MLAQKPAFKELINAAIEFGERVGSGVYNRMPPKKLRNTAIPDVIARQSLELSQFDLKLAKFGGALVSDGKDDVCKDHLLNYVIVCPDGYQWEKSRSLCRLYI